MCQQLFTAAHGNERNVLRETLWTKIEQSSQHSSTNWLMSCLTACADILAHFLQTSTAPEVQSEASHLAVFNRHRQELRPTWHHDAAFLWLQQLDERRQLGEVAEAADVHAVKLALVVWQDERVPLLKRHIARRRRIPATALA